MQVRWEAIRKELKSAASSKGIVLLATKIISITSQMGLWNQQMSYSQLSDKSWTCLQRKSKSKKLRGWKEWTWYYIHDITIRFLCVDMCGLRSSVTYPKYRKMWSPGLNHHDIWQGRPSRQKVHHSPSCLGARAKEGPEALSSTMPTFKTSIVNGHFRNLKLEVPTICPYMVQ